MKQKKKLGRKILSALLTLVMIIGLVPGMSLTAKAATLSGNGTENDPYLITSADDWNTLAASVNEGNDYSEKYLKLTNDITVSKMIGSNSHPSSSNKQSFSGTFDGGGNTLKLNINDKNTHGAAPFSATKDATIKNLKVKGSVVGGIHSAGLVGVPNGTLTVENCTVSAAVSGDTHHGGFVGHAFNATVKLKSCIFDGSLKGGTLGGMIGWSGQSASERPTININNCLFSGTYTDASAFNPVGYTATDDDSATITDFYTTKAASGTATKLKINGTINTAVALVQKDSEFKCYSTINDAVTGWNGAADGATLKLLTDVTTTSTINVTGTKTLDLNDHVLTGNVTSGSVIEIRNSATLNLVDSATNKTTRYYTPTSSGPATISSTGTDQSFTGGYITGTASGTTSNDYNSGYQVGGGVYVAKGSTFNMTGGNIFGVTHNGSKPEGAGVFVCGTFNMTGGEIVGNYNNNNGGGVGTSAGSNVSISDGTISHNRTGWGGGITVRGAFRMSSGTISGNTASCGGGGIHVDNEGNGSPSVTLTGGSITGNTSSQNGGGINCYGVSTFNISGSPVINGNKHGDAVENVYLQDKKMITVNGALTSDASIGVTMQTPGVFTNSTDVAFNDASKFTSDNESYAVNKNTNGQLELVTPTDYKLYVGNVHVTSAKTSGEGWSYDADSNTLTLNGYSFTGLGKGGQGDPTAIQYLGTDGTFHIVLTGENTVTQNHENGGTTWGIYSKADCTIGGTGTLNVSTADGANRAAAIYSEKNLTIADSCTINATSGTVTGAQQGYGVGGGASSILTISENATVTLTGPKGGTNMTVINAAKGIGWTDTAGNQGQAVISTSTQGQNLLNYKKVQFPTDALVATVTIGDSATDYLDFDTAVTDWNNAADGAILTLLADANTTGTISVNGTKTLDLNGYGIKADASSSKKYSVITIKNSANLTIKDSRNTATKHYFSVSNDPSGLATGISDTDSGSQLSFTGGYITGGYGDDSIGGGGVLISGNGTKLTLENGTIIGNQGVAGGGVKVDGLGSFVMNGGAISYNYASKAGGGVRLWQSTTVLNGGAITNNCTPSSAYGSGVALGGGNNDASIAGTIIIKDNKTGDKIDNYYLAAGETVKVSGQLTKTADVGFYTASTPSDSADVKIATGATKDDIQHIHSDNATNAGTIFCDGTKDWMYYNNTLYEITNTHHTHEAGTIWLTVTASIKAKTVTYNANGATGGSVPADSKSPYIIGDTVTVLGNTGSLTKDGYTFDGWNTKADGSGTTYAANAAFTITEDTTLYAQWMKDYAYLDAVWNAATKQVDYPEKSIGADKVTVVNATTTKWNSGWYAVTENVTISGRVTVNGDVKLILCNGKTLTATNGISVDSGKKFTVYGQTKDIDTMGVLNSRTQSTTGVAAAGIGGSGKGKTSGVITINGGKVTASGSREAGGAGIGGGFNASGGTTVINGGVVTVPVRKSVAGIGGGREGSGGNITINGGTVNAGGYAGAAIGGAYHGSAGNITINGGTVTATDGTRGAAIGSGEKKNSSTNAGTIRINGGKVIAKNTAGKGSGGAAIGGGYNVPGGTIIITGGEVTATSVYGAGIGGGPGANGGKVTISGGTVTAYGSSGGVGIGKGNGGKNHGTLTIANDHVCRAGDSESTAGACFNYQSHRKKWVKIWQHIHSEITYGIEGNVLTATCTNDVDNCNLVDGKLTLTLTAPNKLYDAKVYDKAKTAWTSVNHNEWEEFSILTGTTSKSGGSIEYYQGETKLGGAPTEEGTYIAKLPVVLNSQNEYLEQEFMIIKPKAIFVTVPETKELTYNDTEQELITAGVGRDGTIKYSLDDQNYGDDIPVATNAGNYMVWVYVEGDDLHNDSPKVSFDVTIKKKPAPTLTDGQKPTANTAVPEGDDPDKETPLLNPPTEAAPDGYKIVYAIGKDDTNVPETGWSEDIPEGKDGTYYIWFKAVKDDNHEETKPENIKVDRIDYSVALSPSTPTVGEPVTVTVTPKNDSVIYEWYAGTDPDNYTLIEGETGNTYTPTDADKGKTLKVVAKLDDKVIGEDNTASPISETAAEEDKEIIAGDVYGSDGTTKAAGAKIILKRGNTVVATTETDADGKYSFSVESGIYNVVSEYNGVTKTELVEITTSQDFDLTMPEKNTNSVLNISEGTPDIMVGGLDVEAETVRAAQNGEPGAVTVTMTVNKKEESAETSVDVNAIKEKADGKTLEFFETKIVKAVDGTTDSAVTETANVLVIVVPYDFTGKENVTVYRSYDETTEALSDKMPGTDGTFQIDNEAKTITIYTSRLATYAIGYNAINKESVETFNTEKEEQKTAADNLIKEDDSDESKDLVEAAKKAIDELPYDYDKTLDKNKEALDEIINKLEKDLEKQRVLEKLTDTPADVKIDQGEPVINVDTENIPDEYVETVEEIAKNTTADIEDAVIKQVQEIVNKSDDVEDSGKNIVIIPSLEINAKDYDLSEDNAKLTLDIDAVYKSYETTDDINNASDTMSAVASGNDKVNEIGSGVIDTKGTPVDIRIELPEEFAQAVGATTENTSDSPETAFVKHTNNGINYEYDVKLYYDDDVYVAEFVDPNGLGTFTLSGSSESVVSTGGNNYTDLQSAIDDTEDGAVIKLIKDSDISAVIDTEKTITIDKADHTGTVDITVPPTLLLIKTDNEDGTTTYKAVAKYTVSFDANGGTGTMAAQEIGGKAALNVNTFTREGFAFDGWNTKADGKGTAYADKADVTLTADMTLYAQWKENPKIDDKKEDKSTDEKKTDETAKNTTDTPVEPAATTTVAQKNELSINAGFKVTQKGSKITVKWGKVKGATGYEVYVAYCGKNFSKTPAKRTTTKTSAVVTKIGGKKINLKKNFKVYVVAVKKDGSKTTKLAKTITGHIVGRKNTNFTNVKSINLTTKTISVAVGKTSKIKAKTVLVNKKKKQLSDAHASQFRYASTDESIATVDKNGNVKGVSAGTTTVYVYARNGCAKTVSVTVK
ncbi:MAG: InlB B-repeat-containing protein [Lachnospiraceae bacterium]|nr:InlB B-repeat-containing protein [Lachnospiraceae bacterium]